MKTGGAHIFHKSFAVLEDHDGKYVTRCLRYLVSDVERLLTWHSRAWVASAYSIQAVDVRLWVDPQLIKVLDITIVALCIKRGDQGPRSVRGGNRVLGDEV